MAHLRLLQQNWVTACQEASNNSAWTVLLTCNSCPEHRLD